MPILNWAILCQDSAVDRGRNNISLFQIVEQINVPKETLIKEKVAISIPLQLVLQLRREKSDLTKKSSFSLTIDIINPEGENLATQTVEAGFPGLKNRLRLIMAMEGLPIKGIGTHTFRFTTQTKHGPVVLGESFLEVEIKKGDRSIFHFYYRGSVDEEDHFRTLFKCGRNGQGDIWCTGGCKKIF